MNYRYNGEQNDMGEPEDKKKFGVGSVLKWIVYSVCIFFAATLIFRLITTKTPGELKNYLIKTESVNSAYAKQKNELTIYKIDVRSAFALGDALYIESVYYIEAAENLQITLRLNNARLPELSGGTPFRPLLSVGEAEDEPEKTEHKDVYSIGKTADRYRYFVYSFEGVKIDYAKSIVELYIFFESEENYPDTEYAAAKFMIFNINMPKSKVKTKIFDFG